MINKPEGDLRKVNFWEYNQDYTVIFEQMYEADKSKDKTKSSRIMWAFYYLLNPKSDFYNLPNKRDLLKDRFIKDKTFKWEAYEAEEELFKHTMLTQAQRSLVSWDDFMKKRDAYLKGQEYYFDYIDKDGKLVKGTAEQLDKAYGVTPKMYADYDKIMKELKEEEYKTGKGNKIKSLTDAKEI